MTRRRKRDTAAAAPKAGPEWPQFLQDRPITSKRSYPDRLANHPRGGMGVDGDHARHGLERLARLLAAGGRDPLAAGRLTARGADRLAYCAASTVSVVRKPQDRSDASHFQHGDQLAVALGLDMRRWWQPTVAGYLGRVSKARTFEAVAAGVSKGAAESLAKLKKDALAARAEEKLAGTGWLPAIGLCG